jgi:hypothetical protein
MRGYTYIIVLLAVGSCVTVFAQPSASPVSYDTAGKRYNQNFDGLPTTGTYSLVGKGPFNLTAPPLNCANLTGWQMLMFAGSNANAGFAVGTGSSTGNGVYSLGNNSDRALGSLSSSTGIYAMGVIFTNNTGTVLNSFTVSFTAEQWRKGGSGNKNTWWFHYKTGMMTGIDQLTLWDEPNLNFSSVINTSSAAALNGNLPENQQNVSYTVTGINWKPGEQLLLRWDDADEAGNDDAVGMDNFSFSASLVSGLPAIINPSVTNVTSNAAQATATVNDNYALTSVVFEYDSVSAFSSPILIHAQPDSIPAGSGNTLVSANITGLFPGVTYYLRIKVSNTNGNRTGPVQSFTTIINPPTVITVAASAVTTNTAGLGGNVTAEGGAAVTEKGIVWSVSANPTIANNKIVMGTGMGNFMQTVTALPQATILYARAYAINAGGISYGDTTRFLTQTLISSFSAIPAGRTNAASVDFTIKTAQNISGISAGNFSLQTNGITSPSVTGISGTTNSFTVTVSTGSGDGTIRLEFVNDTGISPSIYNKPFAATNFFVVDKTPPVINKISIPDKPMKIGDTVMVSIGVNPDSDSYKLLSAKINGLTVTGFKKINDSTYSGYFLIAAGGNDVAASANIPVSISLMDSIGNTSGLYQQPIIQLSDPIDANKPFITGVLVPTNKTYKLNDMLDFIVQFNESISVATAKGIPSLSLTIGTKSRTALYSNGSNTNNLRFRYTVQAGDIDTSGILLSSSVTLNSSEIKDIAGNTAVLTLNNIPSTKNIFIDGMVASVSSVGVPPNGSYSTGDTLDFTIRFTEKVFVNFAADTPFINLNIGSVVRTAFYLSGSGSNDLWFRYIVQKSDLDKNGITLGSSVFVVNSTITNLSGNQANLTLKNVPSLSNVKIVLIDRIPPVINSVTIPDRAMKIGDTIAVLIFVQPDPDNYKLVTGKINGFTLSGFNKKNDSSYAGYFVIASGGNDVAAADNIPVSISLRDSSGNTSALFQQPIVQSSDPIDANKPFIKTVSVPFDKIYKLGDTLDFVILFNENIIATTTLGSPSLSITIGTKTRTAIFTDRNIGNSLLFRYTVQAGDTDTDGIQLSSSVTLNSSEIKDLAGNTAVTGLNNIPSTKNILVDGIVASISSVGVPANGLYTNGDTLNFIIHFTEKVFVNSAIDSPVLKLTISGIVKNMNCLGGAGSSDLLFRYIVQKGDLDKKGITLGTSIVAGNSSITNVSGNQAVLALKNIPSLSNIKIDAVAPLFVNNKTEIISVCENVQTLSLSNIALTADDETGEIITWKILSDVNHGSLSILNTSAVSNGKTIAPTKMDYKPLQNYTGIDSFLIQVSDGINNTQKTIIINIQPVIKNNSISALSYACINSAATIAGTIVSGGDGSYLFSWETTNGIDSMSFNKALGLNNAQNFTTASLNNTSWFRRKVVSGACTDTSAPVKITVLKTGLWIGNINNDWHNANNWCSNTIPDKATDVYVFPNTLYNPTITDTGRCNHLIVADKACLEVTGILQINGTINAANNAIHAQKAAIMFMGISPQIIPGNAFDAHLIKDLVISNRSGVALNDTLLLSGSLLLNNGAFITNNHLLLQYSAAIRPSAAGTSVSGNVAAEHFIKGGKRAFRLFGHPFKNSIGLQMMKDSLDITGDNGSLNGFTTTQTNQPSAFWHNAAAANDSSGIDAGWIPFTNTNGFAENAWKPYTGIRLFVRGRPGQGLDGKPAGDGKNSTYLPLPVTIKLNGNVNTGDQEMVLARDSYPGYHVIANPYLSPIDLSRITRGNDIGNSYWLWNPEQGSQGGYTAYIFRSKNILPKFGAFVAKANGNTNNKLLFTENCKAMLPSTDSTATIELDDIFYVELRLESENIFWDRIVILEMDSARNSFDKNDAEKFLNSDVNFYTLSREQKMLSVDARPVNNETVIPLGLQSTEPAQFTIRIAKAILPSSNTLLLHDKYLDNWMPLEKDSSYTFSVTTDTASMGKSRFEIRSRIKTADTIVRVTLVTKINPNPSKDKVIVQYQAPEKGNTTIRLVSLSGKVLKSFSLGVQQDGQFTIPVSSLVNGIYLLEIRCGNYTSTQKIVKE